MTKLVTAGFALLALGILAYSSYSLYSYNYSMGVIEQDMSEPMSTYVRPSGATMIRAETTANQPAALHTKKYVELVSPQGFINSEPITVGQFIGKKVVLVTFITYGCINCKNTFTFLKEMHRKYHDAGLQIIAVHTPEFAYERERKNVEREMRDAGITFPVVLDNEYATWRAYNNHYWPARYLIDIHGNITFSHFGEGAYEETENVIRDALHTSVQQ
ncbi:MAG: hypothetical protein RI911_735 [Candidatus Parcubacteria bacterium]|jgi:thiol-disulfide isomerase/thioredoxin